MFYLFFIFFTLFSALRVSTLLVCIVAFTCGTIHLASIGKVPGTFPRNISSNNNVQQCLPILQVILQLFFKSCDFGVYEYYD